MCQSRGSACRHSPRSRRVEQKSHILDFRGFGAIVILILGGGTPRPTWNLPEILSQGILGGIVNLSRDNWAHKRSPCAVVQDPSLCSSDPPRSPPRREASRARPPVKDERACRNACRSSLRHRNSKTHFGDHWQALPRSQDRSLVQPVTVSSQSTCRDAVQPLQGFKMHHSITS